MSVRDWFAAVLLYCGVGIEVACCAGVLAARSFFARLHYTGPATTLGALLVCGAVTVNEGSSQAGFKAIIVAALLVSTGPLIVHATARAARIRDLGEWRLLDEEKARVEEP